MKLFSEVLGRHSLTLQRNAPNILFGGGVAGMIGTCVLASMATLKVEDILDETKEKVQRAKDLDEALKEHERRKNEEELKHQETKEKSGEKTEEKEEDKSEEKAEETEEKSEKHDREIARIYVGASVKIVRLYAPAIVLGSASVAMLTKSHDMLTKRNAALSAAYVALDKGFKEYRARVVEKFGEEEDFKLRYDTETVTVKNETTGKNEKVMRVRRGDGPSIYAKFFDEKSANWSKEPEYNRLFLHSQQRYLNDLLNARGHVFLNEAYDSLDIPRSQSGSVVGWILRPGNDNFIDFGIFTSKASDEIRAFVNGEEGSILLDFNVDGVIYDKIDTPREAPSWQRS